MAGFRQLKSIVNNFFRYNKAIDYALNHLFLIKIVIYKYFLINFYKNKKYLLSNFKLNYYFWDYIYFWVKNTKKNFYLKKSPKVNTLHLRYLDLSTVNFKFKKLYKNNLLISYFYQKTFNYAYWIFKKNQYNTTMATYNNYLNILAQKTFSFGFYYIKGFVFILFIDACLTDDEPLWEPIEWSLVQTWILIIFGFGWIAENLIVSRYGSYTGRDKRVWLSWYKTFWFIEGYYVFNYGVACAFVIVPYYFETNYNLSFIYSWWHWYSRVFFFKFITLYTVILLISYYLQINVRWLNWKKNMFLIILINIFLSYLIYTQFIITFMGFLTDPVWYQKNTTRRLYSVESWAV